MLQNRQKWLCKHQNFKVGDLVLLVNSNARRGIWFKRIITEVFPGSDGCVRGVLVRTATGIFKRDVRKLCMLEEQFVGKAFKYCLTLSQMLKSCIFVLQNTF